MDLKFSAEYEAFRREVKEFIESHWDRSSDRPHRLPREKVRSFLAAATEAGYINRHVPKDLGGSEQPFDPLKAMIVNEEFARVRAPVNAPGNGRLVLPALLAFGTEDQKRKFVPPTLLGDIFWCQGFSEPEAGSDLASVRMSAELVDGNWIISGQKIWTSYAHLADYMFALVRTERDAPKHRGLSYLLIEMKQPGVEIRPLRQLTGEAEFNEVFLTGAKAPAENLVGKRGQGWEVKGATLHVERVGNAGAPSMSMFKRVLRLAGTSERLGGPALKDTEVRQWLANLEAMALAHLYSGHRLFTLDAKGKGKGAMFQYMNKLYSTEFVGMEATRIARELIGDDGLLLPPPRDAKEWPERTQRPIGNEKWNSTALSVLSFLIAGGTSNIQRNVIAEKAYGMPRDE